MFVHSLILGVKLPTITGDQEQVVSDHLRDEMCALCKWSLSLVILTTFSIVGTAVSCLS